MDLCKESNIRYIFLPLNSTHLTQPMDVAVFGPMKKHWRTQLDRFKEDQVAKGMRGGTIQKEMFPSLLAGMMTCDCTINNAANIWAGFGACRIYPLNQQRVLARIPPKETRRSIQTAFNQVLLDELKKRRYGDPAKATRAKKANRLPPWEGLHCGSSWR